MSPGPNLQDFADVCTSAFAQLMLPSDLIMGRCLTNCNQQHCHNRFLLVNSICINTCRNYKWGVDFSDSLDAPEMQNKVCSWRWANQTKCNGYSASLVNAHIFECHMTKSAIDFLELSSLTARKHPSLPYDINVTLQYLELYHILCDHFLKWDSIYLYIKPQTPKHWENSRNKSKTSDKE